MGSRRVKKRKTAGRAGEKVEKIRTRIETQTKEKENFKRLPDVGDAIECLGKDGSIRNGLVIEVSEDKSRWYIEYDKTNKRLDEWVTKERFVSEPISVSASKNEKSPKFKKLQAHNKTKSDSKENAHTHSMLVKSYRNTSAKVTKLDKSSSYDHVDTDTGISANVKRKRGRSRNDLNVCEKLSGSKTTTPNKYISESNGNTTLSTVKKRRRGRPRKYPKAVENESKKETVNEASCKCAFERNRNGDISVNIIEKRGRGRPKKYPKADENQNKISETNSNAIADVNTVIKRGRGRPRKYPEENETGVSTPANTKVNDTDPLIKRIDTIHFGRWSISPWYFSPYPEAFNNLPTLYICEFCFKYNRSFSELKRHLEAKCRFSSPPGKRIYQEGSFSVFEIDGAKNKIYCQNLCLLSRLFLEDKTLFYDVDEFLFYILVEKNEEDNESDHFIGYFSKEKWSPKNFNLACIMTLPPYQGKGYSKLLISLSYELTKLEKKTGGPEEPISDLGIRSYHSYWNLAVMQALIEASKRGYDMSVEDISNVTAIKKQHVLTTLRRLGVLVEYGAGHIIRVKQSHLDKYKHSQQKAKLCVPAKLRLV